jgi:hypothetical protein
MSTNGQTDAPATEAQPGFAARGRLRRRSRFLRKARELAYRDLGGLVFSLHRFGQQNDALVLAKLSTLGQIDSELRALESSLEERQPVTVLREAGVTACPRCAAIHGSEDRFCPNCGLPMSRNVDLPIAAPASPAAPAAGAASSPGQVQAGDGARTRSAPAAPPPTPARSSIPRAPVPPTRAGAGARAPVPGAPGVATSGPATADAPPAGSPPGSAPPAGPLPGSAPTVGPAPAADPPPGGPPPTPAVGNDEPTEIVRPRSGGT